MAGTVIPIRDESGAVVGAYHVPAEAASADHGRPAQKRHHLRVEISEALRRSTTPSEIMALVAARLGEHLGVDRAGYYERDDDHFIIAEEWCSAGSVDMRGRHAMAAFGQGTIDQLRAGEALRLDDTRVAEGADAYAVNGMAAVLSVPVHHDDVWVSGLHVSQAEPRVWTDDEEEFVREIGVQAWSAVERVRAELELRKSEERYRTLFNTIDEGFCVIELIDGPHGDLSDYVHLQANPAYLSNAGIPDIVGKRLREVLAGEADEWSSIFRTVHLTGAPVRFERDLQATGRHLEVAAFRVEPAANRQVAIIFKDVSARKHAERAVRCLNATLEEQVAKRTAERDRMWDTSPDLMLIIDFDGYLRRVNPAWSTLLGYSADELVGHHVNEFVLPGDHGSTTVAYELAAAGGQPKVENRYRHKDGSVRWISWTAAPAGDLTYATGRDITAEKARQEALEAAQLKLRQAQKMEAMGQLTGGVAHDFNNLLTPIIGSLDMLVSKGIGDDRERRLIDGALQSAERAKTLVQRLLAFARRQPLQPTPVDVSLLIAGMADLLGFTLGPLIDIRVDLAPVLPLALADANQLEMALLNLAVNARDAMPDGGELTLAARRESVHSTQVSGVGRGHYVTVCVIDTGVGMDADTVARATEPFFSTKGLGRGTGLGLSMVHGLTAQLGGGLTIESSVGGGTTVKLWLPITVDAVEEAEPRLEASPVASAIGVVLLVDDEALVRASIAEMLIDEGYDVVEAVSPKAAMDLVDDGFVPDLLVTDHLMPGMSGPQLAREIRRVLPDLPVLIVSGYAEIEGADAEFKRLTKPFRRGHLAAAISDVMPGAAAS
ncbi:PAS domain S-box protein [Sphingomonas sp. RS2018]